VVCVTSDQTRPIEVTDMTFSHLRPNRHACWPVLGLCVAAIAPAAVAVDTYSIDGHVIGSGFAQRDRAGCFLLASTIGQPLTGGPVSGGNYSEFAGFWRAYPPDQDGIFSTAFESCGP
jgi:hypothetical protein